MVRPFSCGTQYLDWADSNCCKCDKAAEDGPGFEWECAIEQALSEAAFGDGEVSEEIAKRMGLTDYGDYYGWPCLEKTPAWDIEDWVKRQKAEREGEGDEAATNLDEGAGRS